MHTLWQCTGSKRSGQALRPPRNPAVAQSSCSKSKKGRFGSSANVELAMLWRGLLIWPSKTLLR
jgi:hypothetical protein